MKGFNLYKVTLTIVLSYFITFFALSASATPNISLHSTPDLTSQLTPAEKKWLSNHPIINVAFDADFPPYSYLDDIQQLQGLSVDYFHLIAKKLGISFTIASQSNWQDIYQTAKSPDSPIDVVATMVEKPERIPFFNFTQPYVFKSLVIFTRNDNTTLLKRKNLAHKKIALVKEYQYSEQILQEFPTITPLYVDTVRDALEATAAGKTDGAIAYVAIADWYRDKYFLRNLHIADLYDRNNTNESMAIRKDAPELASILKKTLASITVEEKKQLTSKWLPEMTNHKNYAQHIKIITVSISIVILLLFSMLYLRFKNKKINKTTQLLHETNAQLQLLTDSLEFQVKERTEKLFQLSYIDTLSQLPNKNAFFKKTNLVLNEALAQQTSFAIVCLNIDRFKYINDSLGHKIGDAVIQKVAKRLLENRFDNDIVACFGGDSFTLLLANVNSEHAIVAVRKLLTRFKEPYLVFEKPINISISAGIAMFPEDGATAPTLLQRAEQAMFKAKQEKIGFAFNSSRDLTYFSDYLLLEQSLLRAINQLVLFEDHSPFTLHYQPIKWLNRKGLKGFEALIRWHDEKLGAVSPERFIAMAEDIGKVDKISHWVRITALKQAKTWHEQGIEFGRISVNLSPIELQNPKLISLLEQEVRYADARFDWIEIEITETAVLKNPTVAIDILHQIKQLGATVSIDDFGTGYSSLVYLKQIPADTVKIDREFIKNLPTDKGDLAIDKSIIELCHSLGKVVVAEGVETQEQLTTLTSLACDSIQGYYIAKPMPADVITADSTFFNEIPLHFLLPLTKN